MLIFLHPHDCQVISCQVSWLPVDHPLIFKGKAGAGLALWFPVKMKGVTVCVSQLPWCVPSSFLLWNSAQQRYSLYLMVTSPSYPRQQNRNPSTMRRLYHKYLLPLHYFFFFLLCDDGSVCTFLSNFGHCQALPTLSLIPGPQVTQNPSKILGWLPASTWAPFFLTRVGITWAFCHAYHFRGFLLFCFYFFILFLLVSMGWV